MKRVGPEAHRLRRSVLATVADLPDALVLVACSGGPDSLALAAVCAATDHRFGAVIVDHGLQRGSAEVAAIAAQQCRDLGLDPVTVEAAEPDPRSDGGPEASARRVRYAALATAAQQQAAAAVLLAHTLDDQAETVLLGLARGSGTRSLAGMPARRGLFRRPWLEHCRADVRHVLGEFGLTGWQDPHNDDPAYLRSRVRTTLLPALEAGLGPGVARALARTARLARDDAEALDTWAQRARTELAAAGWPIVALAELPAAVRSRVLRAQLLAAGAPGDDLTAEHVRQVDRLVTTFTGQGPLHLPGAVTAARHCGRLTVAGPQVTVTSGVPDGAG